MKAPVSNRHLETSDDQNSNSALYPVGLENPPHNTSEMEKSQIVIQPKEPATAMLP